MSSPPGGHVLDPGPADGGGPGRHGVPGGGHRGPAVADIGYRLAHHEDLTWRPDTRAAEVTDGVVFEEGDVRVTAAPTDHAPVHPTVGYRVDDGDRSVVIAGDTVPCEGLDRLAAGADVLVHTVVRRDQIEALGVPRLLDVLDYHSAVGDAAATADRAGVGTLVLTHMVPPVQPGSEQEWIDQAAAVFGGTVVLAEDLTTVDLTTTGPGPTGR